LFNVLEKNGNYVFEEDIPLTALRPRVIRYTLEAHKDFVESVVLATSNRALSIGN
jgi:hypothetical protein